MGYLVWSRQYLLEQPGIATIYIIGFQNEVSPSKMCVFSVDEMHDYYLQAWKCKSIYDTWKLADPDLVRIRYQSMRIFSGNFIHGEGFSNEISTGDFRIQLMIMDRNSRISNCNILQRPIRI